MAVGGIKLDISTEELKAMRDEIRRFFPAKQAAEVLAPIVRRAIKPMTDALRAVAPVGPTGNLKRAVTSKVVTYKQNGVAVGVVGFTRAGRGSSASAAGGSVRAGKDRAFHQWWLEYGTKDRQITKPKNRIYARRSPTKPFARRRLNQWELVIGKGVLHTVQEKTPTYIASSFNKLGPFKIVRVVGREGVKTDPGYPFAFFKKSKTPFEIHGVTPGGVNGEPPLATAFERSKAEMSATLQHDLALTIEQAWAAMRYRSTGSVNSTDTL